MSQLAHLQHAVHVCIMQVLLPQKQALINDPCTACVHQFLLPQKALSSELSTVATEGTV